ncbi:MAG TPA: phosphoribosylanthranilate isomerase [Solirubrobacterales bacterium]|nr:phosphoribosylanthranilate isomerase [Solirubrobacterales bacterium]
MKVKICGITTLADAEAAVSAGAWAIGLNHSPESPRLVDAATAAEVGAALKRRCEVAGVFVNAHLDDLVTAAEGAALTLVQLHGEEGPSYCAEVHRRTGCRVIKAFRVRSPAEVTAARAYRTDYHLFDAYRPEVHGGTGASFDWELVAGRRGGVPAILAGGLNADNVGAAVAAANPWGVDVCSGVELEPGVKDHARIEAFMAAAGEAGERQRAERDHRRAVKRVRRAIAHERQGR